MQTLNSVLTLSKDFEYGELVRMNYDAWPIETCYLPFFTEAAPVVESVLPDAIILNLRAEDIAECGFFLRQLVAIQQENPGYAPKILASTATSVMLKQMLVSHQQSSYQAGSNRKQEEFITLEEYPLEVLVDLY